MFVNEKFVNIWFYSQFGLLFGSIIILVISGFVRDKKQNKIENAK